MNKEVAGRLAQGRLEEWARAVSYDELVWADNNESTTRRQVSEDGVDYTIESTVYREQGANVYTMAVRVSEVEKRSFFRKSVSRYGQMFPDGRFVEGA
ncbi:hypothetical protein BH683_017960 [Williamsia sp. 1138]|uniref:hypothetical protein n=1 Tax=Williamsia sp. 1138 TaxID=1903117 RepID=UPI000A11EDA1|nr:hypothetical protein [Williamsia sp. 1138]OZG27748.1 hypothetical protein BH683_017960 [Williamsia sp. 1138]